MARDFSGTNQALYSAATPVTAVPLSMGCWFYSHSNSKRQTIMAVNNSASVYPCFALDLRGDVAGDMVRAWQRNTTGTEKNADTSAGYTINTWQHALGVYATDSDRRAYLNGANKGTNASAVGAPAITNSCLGAYKYAANYYDALDGVMAEAAIWNVALSDADALMLAAGYSPLLVRPESLVAYWPIIGQTSPEIDIVGGYAMTVTGAVAAAHPRVLYPNRPLLGRKTASAPPAAHARSWAVFI